MLLSKSERDHLRKVHGDSQIYIVPHDQLKGIRNRFSQGKHYLSLMKRVEQTGRYVMRYDAENNPAFQQILAMSMIIDKKKTRFYITKPHHKAGPLKRGSCQLCYHTRVLPKDGRSIANAAFRNLEEHFDLEGEGSNGLYLFGALRDLLRNTGETGFVFLSPASKAKMKPEKGRTGKWMTVDELVESYFYFDTWSQMIIDSLFISKAAE